MSEMRKVTMPTVEDVKKKYHRGVRFKQQIGLFDTVTENENFFIGKQWEGVESNGLPTPVFNMLKRVIMFQVASITSDNIAARGSALVCTETKTKAEVDKVLQIVNDELVRIFERNSLPALLRVYARNAAVDGDGCLYTYFDPDAETGQKVKGEIVTEIVENTRVHFGNPNDRGVQRQPYIIIQRRLPVEDVKWQAEQNDIPEDEIEQITPDEDDHYTEADSYNDERVTLLLYFWRDRKTGHIWKMECTEKAMVSKPVDTETKLYPVTWLCWDYVQDRMHGQAAITGLIPNQKFINRLFAMVMLSLMTTAFPKIIYDRTRLRSWDARVGATIAVNGGDMNTVARIMDPPAISPQVSQFIEAAIQYTQNFLGASDVAMGDARPDNTSAIVALQRAANTPLELTKQNLYQSVEELCRIYIDQMRAFYGKRKVEQVGIEGAAEQVEQPFGVMDVVDAKFLVDFDFGKELSDLPMVIKLDVGASSYWSEIAAMQTLDNLLMQKQITILDYLERVPSGYIPKKQELIDALKEAQAAAQAAQAPAPGGGMAPPEGLAGNGSLADSMPIPGGSGNGALQRAIVQEGMAS